MTQEDMQDGAGSQRGRVRRLKDLRNVGKAALADFAVLGIETVEALAGREPAELYHALQDQTGRRHDPCVQDVFAAAIHQARTGEALDWWRFTPVRKSEEAAHQEPPSDA